MRHCLILRQLLSPHTSSGYLHLRANGEGRLSSVDLNLIAEEVGSDPKSLGMESGVLDAGGSTAELVAMWVAPSARGRGVGLMR